MFNPLPNASGLRRRVLGQSRLHDDPATIGAAIGAAIGAGRDSIEHGMTIKAARLAGPDLTRARVAEHIAATVEHGMTMLAEHIAATVEHGMTMLAEHIADDGRARHRLGPGAHDQGRRHTGVRGRRAAGG